MKLHKYDSEEQYREIQIEANKRKLDWVWVKRSSIQRIVQFMVDNVWETEINDTEPSEYAALKKVLCHGTRNAKEQKLFREFIAKMYDMIVIGTEISPTADQFSDTIQWDFHDQKPDWIGNFDIVYSNALDHSHSPKECVQTWLDQLNEDGLLFVEWSKDNLKSNAINPFSGTPEEWEAMFPVVDKISGEGTVIFVMK